VRQYRLDLASCGQVLTRIEPLPWRVDLRRRWAHVGAREVPSRMIACVWSGGSVAPQSFVKSRSRGTELETRGIARVGTMSEGVPVRIENRLPALSVAFTRQRCPRCSPKGAPLSETAVSITAIGVSGVVGPALGALWTRSRQRDDHERDLRAELRGVLDEGAHAVGLAKRRFDDVYNLHRDGIDRDSEDARRARDRWREAMEEVRSLDGRIVIRLGDKHPIFLAYKEWLDTLTPMRNFARAYEKDTVSTDISKQQENAKEAFDPARERFVEAAKQLVGPTLRSV
jgi:hypothetical protein